MGCSDSRSQEIETKTFSLIDLSTPENIKRTILVNSSSELFKIDSKGTQEEVFESIKENWAELNEVTHN